MITKIFHTRQKRNARLGQSTLEFMVIFAAGIGVLFIFLRPGGPLQRVFHRTLSSGAYMMERQMAQQAVSYAGNPDGETSDMNGSLLSVSFATWYGEQGGFDRTGLDPGSGGEANGVSD